MEQKAILNAALRLISNGRFHAASMEEIAHSADLASSTVRIFFESREKLLGEVARHVFRQLNNIVSEALTRHSTFREQYFWLWKKLSAHYTANPAVAAFIEQFDGFACLSDDAREAGREFDNNLVSFFSQTGTGSFDIAPEILARTFHASVRAGVKVAGGLHKRDEDGAAILLWNGMDASGRP